MNEVGIALPHVADGEDKSNPLANRIRKNYKHIRKWARRTQTNCFRIYDKEIHQYPLAIDFYDGHFCVHYFAKSSDSEAAPQDLVEYVERVLRLIFGNAIKTIFWKTRAKSKETRQYEKIASSKAFF